MDVIVIQSQPHCSAPWPLHSAGMDRSVVLVWESRKAPTMHCAVEPVESLNQRRKWFILFGRVFYGFHAERAGR